MFIKGRIYRVKERGTDNRHWWGYDIECIDYSPISDDMIYRVHRTNPNGGMQEVDTTGTLERASFKLQPIVTKRSHYPSWF
jgi:hypothetical protein